MTTAAFFIYSYLRARAVGGCDSFAYLADSLELRGLSSGVNGGLDPQENPAIIPLCHVSVSRHVVSLFPPGFSALLAVAGTLGLESFVTPMIGALSVLLIYLGARSLTRPTSSLLLAAAWACAPIVVWGSTKMMSDLPAATALLASYLLVERRRGTAGGALLALAVCIRPASMLMAPMLWLVARRRKVSHWYTLSCGLGLAILAAFLAGRFGSPLNAAYGRNLGELSLEHFGSQLRFLGLGALATFAPMVALAAWGTRRTGRSSLVLLLWGSVYFVFYALWRHPFDQWWWQRFALSSLPAWMLLAAAGCGAWEARAETMSTGLAKASRAGLTLLLLAAAALGIWQSQGRGLLRPGFDQAYRSDSEAVARLVPDDALVGALNFSGPLRLYGKLETFDFTHPLAMDMAQRALDSGRPLYLVAEPWLLRSDAMALRLTDQLQLHGLATLSHWNGLRLYQLSQPGAAPTPLRARIDVGAAGARPALRSGWAGNEQDAEGTFCWAVGHRATVALRLVPGQDYELSFRAAPFHAVSNQCVDVDLDGAPVAHRLCLDRLKRTYVLPEPMVPKSSEVLLGFTFTEAISPASQGLSRDTRQLAAAFDWIMATPR